MSSLRPAPVRPRVIPSEAGETVLLEDMVGFYADCGHRGAIELVGGPRTGKTTALAHLASLPIADRLVLVDNACPADLQVNAPDRLVVYTTRRPLGACEVRFELAPWGDDDLIEYLLSAHPDECPSVMARFTADTDRFLLDGNPELYCLVAGQMAASGSVQDIRTAVRRGIAERMATEAALQDARFYAAANLLGEQTLAEGRALEMMHRGISGELLGLLCHRWVQVLLTADWLISLLKANAGHSFPTRELPQDLIAEAARLAESDAAAACARLQELAESGDTERAPMAASILHSADPQWRPHRDRCPRLTGARLAAAEWRGIDLSQVELRRVDLCRADLRDADLTQARLARARLHASQLAGARLKEVWAQEADFSDADLSGADMTDGSFRHARLVRSDLSRVTAADADFREVDLSGASFHAAQLPRCDFRGATLENVDFREAVLRGADLSRQELRNVNLRGADLTCSILTRCDLEFLELPAARLRDAILVRSWLTGSTMHGGDFRRAQLQHAGLADIDWEGADLREADLRGCSFHLGSSRSGLVGSPYPCHGSRTGFYTDDFHDQSYRTPETIRKANLCGADLRGACITGVDFYLVDLRGARYDPDQAAHFRSCDAILSGRPA